MKTIAVGKDRNGAGKMAENCYWLLTNGLVTINM